MTTNQMYSGNCNYPLNLKYFCFIAIEFAFQVQYIKQTNAPLHLLSYVIYLATYVAYVAVHSNLIIHCKSLSDLLGMCIHLK